MPAQLPDELAACGVPQANNVRPVNAACRSDPFPIRRHGQCRHPGQMLIEHAQMLARVSVPLPHGAVGASGVKCFPVGSKGQYVYRSCMPVIKFFGALARVKDTDAAGAGGGQRAAVGANSQSSDGVGKIRPLPQYLAVAYVPPNYCRTVGYKNAAAVGRKRTAKPGQLLNWPIQWAQQFPMCVVPQIQGIALNRG